MNTFARPCPHWREEHLTALVSIASFQALAELSLDVMRHMGPPVTMVSGPISTGGKGSIQENLDVFARAIKHLSDHGRKVFNQLPAEDVMHQLAAAHRNENPEDEYCLPILDIFYDCLFRSGLVGTLVMIPDWRSSRGSRWEYDLCLSLGIKIEFLPSDWDRSI